MVAFAGALLNASLVNNYLAPHYQYVFSGQSYSSATGTATWPCVSPGNAAGIAPNATWFDGPGQLSVDIAAGAGGALLVGWGFEGYNNTSTGSSIRQSPHILRGTASVQAASTDLSACSSNSGVGNGGAHHTARWHIYTGFSEGDALTVQVQSYMSTSATTSTVFVDNQWLFVSQFYV